MSMQDLTDAFALIEAADSKLKHFVGPRTPGLIAAAEAAIGSRFPPTYREFVRRYGAGSIAAFEIYGVIGPDFNRDDGCVPDGIWVTLKSRRAGYLPNDLLVVGDAGFGPYFCIELRSGGEGNVVLFQAGVGFEEEVREFLANDFGEFLLSELCAALESDAGEDSTGA